MSIWDDLFEPRWAARHQVETLRRAANLAVQRQQQRNRTEAADLANLRQRVDELELVCRALLATLRERPGWDAQRFAAILENLDTVDGARDGRALDGSSPLGDARPAEDGR